MKMRTISIKSERDQAAAKSRRLLDPTVSIVVTCHNYGHFLDCCLDSALNQSQAPGQVVVVDDGSTDATASVLAGYRDRVEVIRTPNRGQAAAFNTGFAAAKGDLILFLDADDTLRPEALETLLLHWRAGLAVLTFGLETIDAAGRATGLHSASLRTDCGDNRPKLLETGSFLFPPTSGNLFARATLAAALPMPGDRWRISADCYLIRAAALWGPFGHVPQVLGGYRIHGTNNYARDDRGGHDAIRQRENLRDIGDALAALAEAPRLRPADPEEAEALGDALRLRAATLGWASAVADRAPPDPPFGPRGAFRAARLRRPRQALWLPIDRDVEIAGRFDAMRVREAAPTLEFRLDPAPGPLHVDLSLDAPPGAAGRPLTVFADGEVVWRGEATVPTRVDFPLCGPPLDSMRTVAISTDLPEAAFRTIRVGSGKDMPQFPALPVGAAEPAGRSLAATVGGDNWTLAPDGGAILGQGRGLLRFSLQPERACTLVLGLAKPLPQAWLQVRLAQAMLFQGELGQAGHLLIDLPPLPEPRVELAFEVQRLGPDPDPALTFATVGLLEREEPGREPPRLNLGEVVVFGRQARATGLLEAGWAGGSDGPARNVAAESVLAFRIGEGATAVRLAVAPVVPPEGETHVLAVTQEGDLRAAVALQGPGEIEVRLRSPSAPGLLRLVLHSAYVRPGAAGEPGRMAPLALESLTLEGRAPDCAPAPLPVRRPAPAPRWRHLLDRAGHLLVSEPDEATLLDLARLRCDLTEVLAFSAPALLRILAASEDALALLVRIGTATRHIPRDSGEEPAPDGPPATEPLRECLLSMLNHPAFEAPFRAFADLPAPLLWNPDALASYLSQPPDLATAEQHRRYREFLLNLLSEVDRNLAEEPEGSARHRLAVGVFTQLRSTRTIFGQGNVSYLIRLRSRCIERHLTQSGFRLAMPREVRPGTRRLRLGVLVRDILPNPEGWALLGMYRDLDRSRFEPILIRMDEGAQSLDPGARFERSLCLSGLSIQKSVEAVRALDLDLLVTGCYVADWEKTSAVLAHRLAPVQVWHGAVCPTTGGFRSFDVALSCRATEPDDPERHYTEALAWIEGPRQCCYELPPPGPALDLRAEYGLPSEAVLMVSGAMAHKIDDALLRTWAEILAKAPDAVLVLYPFAPNWSMPYDILRFHGRIARELDSSGVARDRVVVLATQTPERVRRIVAAADLYLDSFPYSGATTVCEALSAGTPVLACEGDALRQRTGASWVRAFGLTSLVTGSPEAYREMAIRMATSPELRKEQRDALARTLSKGPAPHFDPDRFGREFSGALWRIAGESGLFPNLAPVSAPANLPKAAPALLVRTATTKLAILASPRTGSTLLCEILNQTAGVLCHYELFHKTMIQYRGRVDSDPEAIRARDADPLAFLDRVMSDAKAGGKALVGFKHFDHLSPTVTRAVISDRSFRLIHLVRGNLLAQYSSEQIAWATSKWVRQNGQTHEPTRVTFDPSDFERWERYQTDLERERVRLLAEAGRDVLCLDYSSLLDPETPERLSRHLGLAVAPPPRIAISKQNPPIILDRFTNRQEVEDYLVQRGLSAWGQGG